ncbi:unnamed protein product [Closterium sp. NIES-54]
MGPRDDGGDPQSTGGGATLWGKLEETCSRGSRSLWPSPSLEFPSAIVSSRLLCCGRHTCGWAGRVAAAAGEASRHGLHLLVSALQLFTSRESLACTCTFTCTFTFAWCHCLGAAAETHQQRWWCRCYGWAARVAAAGGEASRRAVHLLMILAYQAILI